MDRQRDILLKVSLFENINKNDLNSLMSCLGTRQMRYSKGDYLWLAGDHLTEVGILLEGSLQILRDDAAGNRLIVDDLYPGSLFGEAFVCAGVEKSPVTVLAAEDSSILFIQLKRITTLCSSACVFHSTLIANLLKIIAKKNMVLNNKIHLLSQRTIREKIITYLLMQVEKHNQPYFNIPFTRHELADFLCVDRSALSRELGKMQEDGLIRFRKNQFAVDLNLIHGAEYEHI
jgi:CRP-like cAMP-binding protein